MKNKANLLMKSIAIAILTLFFPFSVLFADTYSVTIPDSPDQYDYSSNTLDELGWHTFTVTQTGVISQVTVSFTWTTDFWPEEGSLLLRSPNGTIVTVANDISSGDYSYDLSAFNNESMNGDWDIWIEDSYGDGGHSATDVTITFTYSPATNMTYQSSNVYQITDPTGKGLTNQVILRIEVVMQGTDNPLSATSFSLSTTGTTNTADIANAKLFYTGTSSTFSTSNQFGSTISNPSGNFTITGNQQLQNGTNYFWLTYDIANNATVGNVVDAVCNSITIGGSARTPSTTSPSGNRTITYLKIYSESFDGTAFPPTGWQTFTTRGTSTRVWERVTSGSYPTCSPHSGAAMAYYNSFSISSGNAAALVSPPFDLSQRGSYPAKVRFWMYRDPGYSSSTDSIIVYINTSASTSGATRLGAIHRYNATAGWYFFEYSIPSSFTGSTNYLIFEAYSGYGNNMFLDDVSYDAYPDVMRYSSSTTTQITGAVGVGFTNQPIIRLEVTMQGAADPLSLTSITFNTTGTTNTADIASAKVYYTGISSTFSTSTQFGTTVTNPSGTFTITGNQQLSAGTNYFWLVYDVSASATEGNFLDAQCTGFVVGGTSYTPSVTNPTGNREIRGPRVGTYTVGTGQYYSTLSEAFTDINLFGMKGNVTLLIMTDINETGATPPTLNQWAEYGGSGYRLYIQPSGGSRTIQGSYTTGLVVLSGADRVTIDGSIGGSGRYLTFQNNTTSSTSSVIWISSLGTNAGCNNVTIRNCNIVGPGNSSSFTGAIGIYAAGTSVSTSGNGADNDNLTIENNHVRRVYYGIFTRGPASTTGTLDNLIIRNNIVGADISTDYVGYRGIDIQGAPYAVVSGNTIYNIKRTDGTNLSGIEVNSYCQYASIVGNKIYGIYQESSGGWGAYGINVNTSTGNSYILIANNMIFDLHTMNYSSSSTTYNPFGIRIVGGTYHKIYHNTVYLYGYQANVGSSASMSACLIYTSSSVTYTDVRNNIFVNALNSYISSPASKMYAVYFPSGTSFATINYNDYYATGNFGILGFLGSDRTTITDWQSATGQDNNSINVEPNFISMTDLHLTGATVGDKRFLAPALSDVTVDFDGETRRSSNVTFGCDEVRPIISTSAIGFSPDYPVYCKDGSVTMSISASITGYQDGISRTVTNPIFDYQWAKNTQPISGAYASSLELGPLSQSDSADYGCYVSFFGESPVLTQRHLKVESPIEITEHPQNRDICVDLNPMLTLYSNSTGTITGWQWQKFNPNTSAWEDVPGATQQNLVTTINDPYSASGRYRVVVLGPGNCGPASVASNWAEVNVTETVKDNFISCDKDPLNICELDNFILTTTARGTITGYRWQKFAQGSWVDLDLSKFPTANQRTLQFTNADPSMSGRYRLLVYGSQACYPDGQPVVSNEIDIVVWPLFRIVEQPQPQSLCYGEDFMLYIVTQGTILYYQWMKDGEPIMDNPTANTAVLYVENAKFENSGVYKCKLTIQDCRGIVDVYTNEVLIYVHSQTKITKTEKEQIVKLGDVAKFEFDAHVEGIPPTYNAEIQWYRGNFPLIDNDRISGSKSNILTIRDVKASDLGSDYWVVVTGKCGSDTARDFSITAPDIQITRHPGNLEICEGEDAEFSVQATITGGTSIAYQWRKDGMPLVDNGRITGSQTNTLKIENVTLSDVGQYDVEIINLPSGFTRISQSASLIVNVKPSIVSQPSSPINLNQGDVLTLEIEVDGTPPFTVQWYKDGEAIVGADSTTFTKEDVTTDDAGTYYCVVTNDCGSATSQEIQVVVTYKTISGLMQNSIGGVSISVIPNPVTNDSKVIVESSEFGYAKLILSDSFGRDVLKLFEGNLDAGKFEFSIDFDGNQIASGVYQCKLIFNNRYLTIPVMIVR